MEKFLENNYYKIQLAVAAGLLIYLGYSMYKKSQPEIIIIKKEVEK